VATRTYDQQCPIACGLDVLGERWTLLILRELLGGPRRYSDLRAELPGIATNLLADRLRELEAEGLVERTELPPPAARTVYRLTDRGWQQIPPILQAIAWFGLGHLPQPAPGEKVPPLTGFLVILMAFDRQRAGTLDASYLVNVDGRLFEFAVRDGQLAAARGEPEVRLTASAKDLVELRLASDPKVSARIASRLAMEGSDRAQSRFRTTFALPG
jgi:DNA-binding HxlR family transcriptional regulator